MGIGKEVILLAQLHSIQTKASAECSCHTGTDTVGKTLKEVRLEGEINNLFYLNNLTGNVTSAAKTINQTQAFRLCTAPDQAGKE